MTFYIEKFRSGLRQTQSDQLLSLITKERDRGSITSVQEFRDRLQELTAKLSSEVIQPTLNLYLGELREFIDSESYSFMLDRIQDDLTSAYSEMNSIDEVIDSHETIINDVVLRNLDVALNQLEAKIESLEFIKKNQDGFDDATFNTFRLTDNQRETAAQILFLDPKGGYATNVNLPAQVDTAGEKLLLKTSVDQEYDPAGARQIFDFEATGSELEVELNDSDINHIVDNTKGTFWAQSVLLTEPKDETGVTTKLEIDLGTVRSVNLIQVEPLILYPVDVVGIDAIDANGEPVSVLTEPLEIRTTNRFFFNTVSAKKIVLKFRNRNYTPVQFETKPDSPIPELVRDLTNYDENIISIEDELNEVISSPRLKAGLSLQEFQSEEKSYYEYLIGFDNIRVGLGTFEDVSVFTSKSKKVKSLGQVAVQTTEKRPVGDIDSISVEYTLDTYPSDHSNYFHGSQEFYVVKRDFSAQDALLRSEAFPVLPLGATEVRHERLLLTTREGSGTYVGNDTGTLQFFTLDDPYDATLAPAGTIRVYRNGQDLPNGDLDALVSDGWVYEPAASQATPGQSRRMRYAVRIQQPNPNNIYTVSYTPAISTSNNLLPLDTQNALTASTGLNTVDLTGNLRAWLGKDNIVYFREDEAGVPVDYSTVTLAVVLRRNSANSNLTPVLEDYLLATGTRSSTKFGG